MEIDMSDTSNLSMEDQEKAPLQSVRSGGGSGRVQPWPKDGAAVHYQSRDPRVKSPLLAAFLSLVPGLGQIYVGYYQRGFINPLVVGVVISILFVSSESTGSQPPGYLPLCILFLIFFWLYNIIDAWRRASMYNLALEGIENIPLPDDMTAPGIGGSMFGGVVLVLAGFVCLLYTRFGLPLQVLQEWWPIAPMAFGGYLVYRAIEDRKTKTTY